MRVAWMGPGVGDVDTGSAAALAGMLLRQLLENDVEVDLYFPGHRSELPRWLQASSGLRVVDVPVNFEWNPWHGRNRITRFVSGFAARSWTQIKLGWRLIRNHRHRRYDAIFQFSQMELFVLGRARRFLPPIVVHPCTTASGELRWHRRESRYALQSEPWYQHFVFRAYLVIRAFMQRREVKRPAVVVGPSVMFNRLLCEDYGLDPTRTRVLRHPVDGERFLKLQRKPVDGRPIYLLYASRLSTRKGLELIVGLSHRLVDLEGDVKVVVLGGGSMWSDYRAHVTELNPAIAKYHGEVHATQMPDVYAQADVMLVPSHYEPGSLVVGEALAAGLPVVASDQVGPVEVLDPRICRVFPRGDLDAFEAKVRALVLELRSGGQTELASIARREAVEQFSPERMGSDLLAILREATEEPVTEARERRPTDRALS